MQTENIDVKNILGLQLPTDPRWVNLAEMQLEEILTDHAYCEQKAATTCISLIQRYPDKTEMVEELAPIVTEEWGHFRMVLTELKKRNLQLGKQRKDEYVNRLLEFQKKDGSVEDRLLDRLLTMALIEARSCERFKRLSENLDDEYMRNFYRKFMESEAGHYTLFITLAETYLPKEKVRKRWKQWLDFEKEMIEKLDIFVEGGRGDLEYKELFSEVMLEYCMEHNTLKHDGRSFVMMATKLMERLLEYRFLINDESKENRMACTVSLLQFYSEVNRKEMYIRYFFIKHVL